MQQFFYARVKMNKAYFLCSHKLKGHVDKSRQATPALTHDKTKTKLKGNANNCNLRRFRWLVTLQCENTAMYNFLQRIFLSSSILSDLFAFARN